MSVPDEGVSSYEGCLPSTPTSMVASPTRVQDSSMILAAPIVVGSVGGSSESVGRGNTIPHAPAFSTNFDQLIVRNVFSESQNLTSMSFRG